MCVAVVAFTLFELFLTFRLFVFCFMCSVVSHCWFRLHVFVICHVVRGFWFYMWFRFFLYVSIDVCFFVFVCFCFVFTGEAHRGMVHMGYDPHGPWLVWQGNWLVRCVEPNLEQTVVRIYRDQIQPRRPNSSFPPLIQARQLHIVEGLPNSPLHPPPAFF